MSFWENILIKTKSKWRNPWFFMTRRRPSKFLVWIQSNLLSNYLYPQIAVMGRCSAPNQYPVNFRPHSDPSAVAHTYRPPLWRKAVNEQNACWSSGNRALDKPDNGFYQRTGLTLFSWINLFLRWLTDEWGLQHH